MLVNMPVNTDCMYRDIHTRLSNKFREIQKEEASTFHEKENTAPHPMFSISM